MDSLMERELFVGISLNILTFILGLPFLFLYFRTIFVRSTDFIVLYTSV